MLGRSERAPARNDIQYAQESSIEYGQCGARSDELLRTDSRQESLGALHGNK